MFWLIRWLAFRTLALVIGGGLYLYAALYHTEFTLGMHDWVGRHLTQVRDSLPRESRVIFHGLSFERMVVMTAFIFTAMLVVDVIGRILWVCGKGVKYLVSHK
jgi:hypothetical protein